MPITTQRGVVRQAWKIFAPVEMGPVEGFKRLAIGSLVVLAVLTCAVYLSDFWLNLKPKLRVSSELYESATSASLARNGTSSKPKLILIYTLFFSKKPWPGIGAEALNLNMIWRGKPCRVQACEWTYNRSRFAESDLVIFHGRNMPPNEDLNLLLKKKRPSQRWAYYLLESPKATRPDTRKLNGFFHWTLTYRRDSDFWSPYGSYTKIGIANQTTTDFSAGKDKLVAWIVSNCGPRLRKSFVHELRRYVKVDVFGRCSTEFNGGSCSGDCKEELKRYKFYLSLENALCLDYATEKYWKHLGDENVVPVVMNDPKWFNEVGIPGSYINVLDFKTVKDLAEYLQYLDKNSSAYNEYFKWRQDYRVNHFSDNFDEKLLASNPWHCLVCEALNSANISQPKAYDRLSDWWVGKAKCGEMDHKIWAML